MASAIPFPLTVYYDASCPLCASEMHALAARDRQARLALVDCAGEDFDDRPFAADGVTRAAMLREIHARAADGRWLKGVDVFAAVYRVAGFPHLARLFASARLRPLWTRLYPWIARNRHRLPLARVYDSLARSGCGRCGDPTEP